MDPIKKSEAFTLGRHFAGRGRLAMIRLLAFTVPVLLLAATSYAQERPPIFQQMYKAYGFESFGQVEKIRYTFNLEVPGLNLS
ncbi:MAG: hypothetical protein WA439_01030, partial [Pseudolabrys sp.]